MKRDFKTWLNTFQEDIADYSYYVDFQKVYENVDSKKIELNILNSLIGSKNIKKEFEDILQKFPNTMQCIPILLAVRDKEISIIDNGKRLNFNFNNPNYSIAEYSEFMEKSGLFDLISKHVISNLVDYVTGVEVGLDSNGRKNRGGHLMEDIVEKYIIDAGFVKDETYFKEMYISDVASRWGVDLSGVSNDGKTEKRFDYVVKTKGHIYVVETNFYRSGGSKLNETARSYKTLVQEIKKVDGVTFVWFTDGTGWDSARNNLEETFDVLDTIYNIADMRNGIIKQVFK